MAGQNNLEHLDKIFRAYDIRGIIGDQLSEDFFYKLGIALVRHFNAEKIVVGRDFRADSERFQCALICGIIDEGAEVVDIGEIASEMLYFAAGEDKSYDCGAVVTASHNPSEYNGCKIVGRGAAAVSGESGLMEIKRIVQELSLGAEHMFEDADLTKFESVVKEVDVYSAFKEKIMSMLDEDVYEKLAGMDMRIAVDAGNGIGGKIFEYVFADIPVQIERMYFEPDSSFPNHVPNPIEEENMADIKKAVVSKSLDLGVAIDGDADRVFFVDKKGRNPNGVYIGALLADHLLKKSSGGTVLHDPRVVRPIRDAVNGGGGVAKLCKSGHSFFKQKMKEEGALFGAELSGHFYYRDFYFADSGMITIATMLNIIASGMDIVAEVDKFYEKYPTLGEVNFTVDSVEDTLSRVERHFISLDEAGKVDKIDGLSIQFEGWRLNLRASNTQPLIRLNLEASSKELLKEKFFEARAVIGGKQENEPAISF